jgi:mandelamide amidase
LPASLCGVVGFRPTVGRYSGQGIVPISHTRDTAGPITRSVPDVILLDRVMCSGSEESSNTSLKGLRLGVPREYFYDDLDPDVAVASEKVLSLLQAEGVHLVEEDINGIGDMNNAVSFPIALYEFISDLPKYLTENKLNFSMQDICNDIGSPDVKGLFESLLGEGAMPESVYKEAIESGRPKLQEAFREYFANQSVDAIIFPTSPLTARPIGQDETVELNGVQQPTFPTFIRNTDPSSNAGIPGISLPISISSSGLPIGIELDAPVGRDDRLLSIAQELEKVFEFSARPQL